MNRRKFISVCSCCAFASAGAVLCHNTNNLHLTDNKKNNFIDSLDIHIVEHCNLKCKHCNHFSCIAEEEFYDLDEFEQDIKQTSKVILQEYIKNLVILGGEPLLNPQILEYVKHSRKSYPDLNLTIATNGVLLDKMDEKFWKTLNEYNVSVSPTIYPIKINWKSILDKAKKYNVMVYGNNRVSRYTDEITLDNIDEFMITSFGKRTLNEKTNNNSNRIKCLSDYFCTFMDHGKFYTCSTIAYVRHLNKKFNTNFIVTKDDYLDLYKAKNYDEVTRFMNKRFRHFCKYCVPKNTRYKWENSPEHSLSEWT